MKEPSLPYRQKRPPSLQKLKLLCSFNGAFHPRPPSGRLRYVGGESRIISIDRSSGISRLRSKISDSCPENPFLALKYQLPVVPGLCNDRDGPPLVSLITDDDVRHMVEEYDRALSGGKDVRLRVFVICSENAYVGSHPAFSFSSSSSWNVSDVDGSALPSSNNALESRFSSSGRFLGFCNLGDVCGLNGSESKISTTQIVGVPSLEDPFRRMPHRHRPQILTSQMAGIPKSGDFLASDASKTGIGSPHVSLKTSRPQMLITNMSRNQNFATDSCSTNNLRSPKPTIAYVDQARHSGGSLPLLESRSRSSSSRPSEGLAHERRFGSSSFNQLMGTVQFPNQIYNSKTVEHASVEDLNRKNISPQNAAYGEAGAPSKFLARIDEISSNPSCSRIKSHRNGTGNLRHNQIGLSDARGHRNCPHDNCNYRVCSFDLKPCYGKINAGLRPRSDISKVGQTKSHQVRFIKAWHGAHGHPGVGVPKMTSSCKGASYPLGHANEGKMKDSVCQLTARRLPVDPLSFQGGLHETGFGISNFHKNGAQNHNVVWNGSSSCHISNPPWPPYAEKQPQCFGETTFWKNTDCGNYFSSSNQFLGAYQCGFGYQAASKPHCHDLSLELSPNAPLSEGNVYAAATKTYSVSNTRQKDVAVPSYSEDQGQNTRLESMTNMISPLYDWDTHLGLLTEIHKKASVKDFSSEHNGRCSETPLDHSVHNLSLLSLTEDTITTSSSDDLEMNGGDSRVYDQNNPNGTETFGCHNALWDCKMKTQCDQIVASSPGLLTKDWAEDGKCRRDDDSWAVPSHASFKDVAELGSPLKSSEESNQYEVQRSCTTVENLSNGREKKQRAPSKPGMEEEVVMFREYPVVIIFALYGYESTNKRFCQANGETSGCYSEVVDQPSSELVRICSRLATQELQTIQNSDLEEIRELGSGTYGTVFYGKWKGSDVAIKRIKPSCFEGGELGEDRLIADFWKEADLLSQLHHPNVVAFYGVVKDGAAANFATVTEYMVNGSLKQVLQRKDRTIDRRKRLIIAMDAAFGMEYLHEKNVAHFDLKSHNFLVNMRDPLRPVCKIGDLGLSKVKQRTLVSGGVRGTIPWMAPELLTADKSTMVTEKVVDVFSFGIVMWELLTGEEPYADMRSEGIIAGIIEGSLRPEIPSWCDPAWSSLIERCWSSDPGSRPSFSEIAKELRSMSASMNIK
ncbi:hypothetical protein ACLOJK_031954 [Asimina triloba]